MKKKLYVVLYVCAFIALVIVDKYLNNVLNVMNAALWNASEFDNTLNLLTFAESIIWAMKYMMVLTPIIVNVILRNRNSD